MLKIIPGQLRCQPGETYIKAKDMEPLAVGQIDDTGMGSQHLCYVMRTQSADHFQIMNLSQPKEDHCWTAEHWNMRPTFRVRLLRPDEPLIIELRNE